MALRPSPSSFGVAACRLEHFENARLQLLAGTRICGIHCSYIACHCVREHQAGRAALALRCRASILWFQKPMAQDAIGGLIIRNSRLCIGSRVIASESQLCRSGLRRNTTSVQQVCSISHHATSLRLASYPSSLQSNISSRQASQYSVSDHDNDPAAKFRRQRAIFQSPTAGTLLHHAATTRPSTAANICLGGTLAKSSNCLSRRNDRLH